MFVRVLYSTPERSNDHSGHRKSGGSFQITDFYIFIASFRRVYDLSCRRSRTSFFYTCPGVSPRRRFALFSQRSRQSHIQFGRLFGCQGSFRDFIPPHLYYWYAFGQNWRNFFLKKQTFFRSIFSKKDTPLNYYLTLTPDFKVNFKSFTICLQITSSLTTHFRGPYFNVQIECLRFIYNPLFRSNSFSLTLYPQPRPFCQPEK